VAHHVSMEVSSMWQAWTNGFLGLWLIIAAFIRGGEFNEVLNSFGVGVAAMLVGWLMKADRPWQGWASLAIGVALTAAPFLYPVREAARQWLLAGSGVLLSIAGFTALADHPSPTSNDQSLGGIRP
jgi:hypothetical protein